MPSIADDIEVAGEANPHGRALATVSEQRPDVVLLDPEMPGMVSEEADAEDAKAPATAEGRDRHHARRALRYIR
jgi:chemotaxis response regulator CheB